MEYDDDEQESQDDWAITQWDYCVCTHFRNKHFQDGPCEVPECPCVQFKGVNNE